MGSVLDSLDFEIDSDDSEKELRPMARQPRFQYAGAVYHVMARGDGESKFSSRRRITSRSCIGWRRSAGVTVGGCMLGS